MILSLKVMAKAQVFCLFVKYEYQVRSDLLLGLGLGAVHIVMVIFNFRLRIFINISILNAS